MHRYYAPLPNLSPWWLVVMWVFIILVVGSTLYEGAPHHEVGVRHALTDPYVPQCYAIKWESGRHCEFVGIDEMEVLK